MTWPDWWAWELELTPHIEKRMEDRDFTEVDLRDMLEHATGYRPVATPGRYAIEATFRGRRWHVIIEPDHSARMLIAITAYRSED